MNTPPFDIEHTIPLIRQAVAPYPKAALFELYDAGFTTPFELLLACIISIRTLDEVMLPCARQLFALGRTPAQVSALTPAQIDQAIARCTFHENKARQIHTLAQRLVADHAGVLPCEREVMLALHGVGPKCANLVLGIACHQPHIGVDIHVHRITNRWGYVQAPTPEKTMLALQQKLPQSYWVEINKLLVPFGKHICTGARPKCSACPVRAMCQQVGVTQPR